MRDLTFLRSLTFVQTSFLKSIIIYYYLIDKYVKTLPHKILTKHSLVKTVQTRTLTMRPFSLEVFSSDKD